MDYLKNTAAFAVFFYLFAVSLFARNVEITVEDADLGLPLEGAQILSWDGSRYTCDRNGIAIVFVPEDRQVLVHVSYPGYESSSLIITTTVNSYVLGLRLSGFMEGRELVIEAARPGASETRTGRSVAVGSYEISRSAEIGIIEDLMSSIKLLPGVGYTGLFNALPSIRGGDPGDLTASLDGFYISMPYHWGGGFSIFDPRMVQSAQLSHGVFSVRYGNTISGLLEVQSKRPSNTETMFEIGAGTSAANFSLSFPLAANGGLLFIGRITYYEPIVWLMKELSNHYESLEPVQSIRTAPYIRSGTLSGNYRFTGDLELQATGFWGMDGVGAHYENSIRSIELNSDSDMNLDWTNYQGFFTTKLNWVVQNNMLLQFTAGAGYEHILIDAYYRYNILEKSFSEEFTTNYLELDPYIDNPYSFNSKMSADETVTTINFQGRIDYDWEVKDSLLFSAGIQHLYSNFSFSANDQLNSDIRFTNLDQADQNSIKILYPGLFSSSIWDVLYVNLPVSYTSELSNNLFSSSAYAFIEYNWPNQRFNTELGLRIDHFYLNGKNDLTIQSRPVFNPRLNIDYNVFTDRSWIQSMDISAGTGLFSSVNYMAPYLDQRHNVSEIIPNRSWTSILGTRLEFPNSLFLNLELYYKYIFNRSYIPVYLGIEDPAIHPQFDGEGRVWGIDLLLQKMQSRFWDGWLSYSFNWAKYRDPGAQNTNFGIAGGNSGDQWYFPGYHRFHSLNLILNIKPVQRINIYTRFGLASGVQIPRRIGDGPISYPVFVYDSESTNTIPGHFIEKYYWPSVLDENKRSTVSLPLDIKISVFGANQNGKVRYEVYAAVENILALLYSAQGNTSFNQYTGTVDTGSNTASYELPVPVPSFGFRISY